MADFIPREEKEFKGKEDLNILYIDKRETSQSLMGKWKFGFFEELPETLPSDDEFKYEATLPSSVYMNVYEAGILPHPYLDTNSKKFTKLDEKAWYFSRKFTVSKENIGKSIILCCDGIAYYSRIWINDIPVVSHEGMFGGPYADISSYVKIGSENDIKIQVLAANYGHKETYSFWNNEGINREIVPWNLMHDNATSNGDFTVVGIWNDIRLEFLDKYHMARPHFVTESIDIDGNKAKLFFEMEISDGSAPILNHLYGKKEGTFYLSCQHACMDIYKDESVDVNIVIKDKKTGEVAYSQRENVKILDFAKSFSQQYFENQFYQREIVIENPKIWDPMISEKPEIYEAVIEMYYNGAICDMQKMNLGIRTVTTQRAEGTKYRLAWNNWQFVVNGKKVFIKGMNWTPIDYLYDISPEKYEIYLKMIKNQGVNMVRVWSGGGMPETETFYNLCDELGLMVWQDNFPANTISTKGWPIDVLESQVALNLFRIRKHPSIVLHCGGNEINPYTDGNTMSLYTIRRLVEYIQPETIFHQAALDMGSAHIYSDMEPVWYGKILKNLPFLGESGIHSFPSYETLKEVISGDIMESALDLSKPENLGTDPGLLNHFSEFCPERVPRMLSRTSQIINLKKTSIKEISMGTQIASHEFYTIMLQSMRNNYPFTTGAMPWVFKRPWPTVGVQIVDGFGRPLYQYYAVQNAFRKNIVMLDLENITMGPCEKFVIKPAVIMDEEIKDNLLVQVEIYGPNLKKDYDFKVKWHKNGEVTEYFRIPESYTDKYFYVVASLYDGEKLVARSTYNPKVISKFANVEERDAFRSKINPNLYFENGPWLYEQTKQAEKAEISGDVEISGEKVKITLANKGKVPGIFTRISYDDSDFIVIFDDNCFTIEPSEVKIVTGSVLKGKGPLIKEKFTINPFNS